MNGKITVIAGPSGVGKTSLLNLLVPGQELKTGQVSRKLGRGRHTTRHVQLFPLPFGGWVADTPGFTVVDNPPIKREELAPLFIEFAEPSAKCRFLDCLHSGEVDCGVKDAVRDGTILASRHQNYLTILERLLKREVLPMTLVAPSILSADFAYLAEKWRWSKRPARICCILM